MVVYAQCLSIKISGYFNLTTPPAKNDLDDKEISLQSLGSRSAKLFSLNLFFSDNMPAL